MKTKTEKEIERVLMLELSKLESYYQSLFHEVWKTWVKEVSKKIEKEVKK